MYPLKRKNIESVLVLISPHRRTDGSLKVHLCPNVVGATVVADCGGGGGAEGGQPRGQALHQAHDIHLHTYITENGI